MIVVVTLSGVVIPVATTKLSLPCSLLLLLRVAVNMVWVTNRVASGVAATLPRAVEAARIRHAARAVHAGGAVVEGAHIPVLVRCPSAAVILNHVTKHSANNGSVIPCLSLSKQIRIIFICSWFLFLSRYCQVVLLSRNTLLYYVPLFR